MEKQKPSQTAQSTGKVFVMLLTNQINESQQCHKKDTKLHQIVEVELVIFHKHHLHSVRMKVNHPCHAQAWHVHDCR